jgi:MFS family permease
VFYGWWVVATAALALCLGAGPIVVFSFGVFFKLLSRDFHAGRAAISFAFTLQNLTAAVCAPLTGRLISKLSNMLGTQKRGHDESRPYKTEPQTLTQRKG